MADKFYQSKEWIEMRRLAKARDKYKCQICGVSVHEKGTSQVDHIIPVKQAPSLALDINNLRTLCRPCHVKFDAARGYKNLRPIMPVDEDGYPDSWK